MRYFEPLPNASPPMKHWNDDCPGGETRCSRASKGAQRRRATGEPHDEGEANGEGSTEATSR